MIIYSIIKPVESFLSSMYSKEVYNDSGRFISILFSLLNFFGGWFILISAFLVIVFPFIFAVIIYYVTIEKNPDKSPFDLATIEKNPDKSPFDLFCTKSYVIFGVLFFFFYLMLLFVGIFSLLLNPSDSEKFIKELSPYSLSYSHNFDGDLHSKISDIYMNIQMNLLIFTIFIFVIIKEIIVYGKINSSIFSFLQAMSGVILVIYSVYNAIKIGMNININPVIDARVRQTYGDELDQINKKDDEVNPWSWFFLNVFVYLFFSFLHVAIFGIGENFKKKLYEFMCNSIGIGGIIVIWMYKDVINNFMKSMIYLVKTYDIFSSVMRQPWELNRIKSFDSINNIELYIRKYMYINIPEEMLATNELVQFAVRFNRFVCSGDIAGADAYLKKCPSEELRALLYKELRNIDNLLLSHVGISFQKMCNSFLLKEIDKDHEEYVSLVSKRGRIVVVRGESGSGKSTMHDSIMGDNQFMSSYINGYPSYLVNPDSKKLIPCYSDKFGISIDGLSLMENMQLFDLAVSRDELMYIWNYIGISKYMHQLSRIMGLIHLSKGQRDRMAISKILVSLNNILKDAAIKRPELKDDVLRALSKDVSDDDLINLCEGLKLGSFMVVLDEPLGALDKFYAGKVMELIKRYSKLGFSFWIIDHSGIAAKYADDEITIKNKTCEYSTIVDGQMINIKNLKFENSDTLVIGDTIAYKHICKKPMNVNEIRKSCKNGDFKDMNICIVNDDKRRELLSTLRESRNKKDPDNISVDGLSNSINDFDSDQKTSIIVNDTYALSKDDNVSANIGDLSDKTNDSDEHMYLN